MQKALTPFRLRLKGFRSETGIILAYFFSLIFSGTLLLYLPFSWSGNARLPLVDAFFTASSAVCVTGLVTVDTAMYSFFGKFVILLLIQSGGLGLISFSSFYLVIPAGRPSLRGSRIIREYYLDSVEYEPFDIVKQILFMTFSMEAAGALLLYKEFAGNNVENPLFVSLFHSVSAFCNAGFSTFSNSLENYRGNAVVNITVMVLIASGGIGFVVFRDIVKKALNRKRQLTVHSKIVLSCTVILIASGAVSLFLIERNQYMAGYDLREKILASLFQSVTARTAGFNTVPINQLDAVSQMILIPLMFIGGAPGSIAGGIKVTTFLLVMLSVIRQMDERMNLALFRRNISRETIFRALIFMVKSLSMVFAAFFLLAASEHYFSKGIEFSLKEIAFECFSAFGTVGLSLGITGSLSVAGKIVVILTMFTGRFGILLIVMNLFRKRRNSNFNYPEEKVLIG